MESVAGSQVDGRGRRHPDTSYTQLNNKDWEAATLGLFID